MHQTVPFLQVLAFLEEHGWDLTGIWTPVRVFTRRGKLPILVEVHDKAVSHADFENIKARVKLEEERDNEAQA
jgi:hypothetical protein